MECRLGIQKCILLATQILDEFELWEFETKSEMSSICKHIRTSFLNLS